VFYDKGSNVTMIRNEMASKLGLEGRDVKQKLVRSGGDVMDWDTKAYSVPLIKKDGSRHSSKGGPSPPLLRAFRPSAITPPLLFLPLSRPFVRFPPLLGILSNPPTLFTDVFK
jgi:hypothetical protein